MIDMMMIIMIMTMMTAMSTIDIASDWSML